MLLRATGVVCCVLALVLTMAGCSSPGQAPITSATVSSTTTGMEASTTTGTTLSSTGTTVPVEVLPLDLPGRTEAEQPDLEELVRSSDLVVHGRVVAEAPARWNGLEGERWTPDTSDARAMLYTTWLVQIWGVFKGPHPVGDLVAVRTEGGSRPGSDKAAGVSMRPPGAWPALVADDQVVVCLKQEDTRYMGTYEPGGYWLTTGAGSVFIRNAAGQFARQGVSGGAAEPLAPEDLFARIEAAAASRPAGGNPVWRTSEIGLSALRDALSRQIPAGADVILPSELPAGWGVAAAGQSFPADVAMESDANPMVAPGTGQYRVLLTDTRRLVAIHGNVVGDWGETPFLAVWANSHAVLVFVSSREAVAIRPDLPGVSVVGEPESRGAVVEMAGLLVGR